MAQLGLGAAAVVLFLTVGKSYINYIGAQLREERAAHERELVRLIAVWEARLADSVKRGDAWETAAHRYQQANLESAEQVRKLTGAERQTVLGILTAIREEQERR
jgi:hypothetical protein